MNSPLQQPGAHTVNVIDTGMQQAILTEIRNMRDTVTEVRTTVASYPALIERQATTEQRQQETEGRFADALEKVEQSIIRIHDRMDEVRDIVQKDMMDVKEDFRSFRDEHRKEVVTLIEANTSSYGKQVADLTRKVTEVKTETEGWINKGKGAKGRKAKAGKE
jgi:trehalose-6-phosphate synthase